MWKIEDVLYISTYSPSRQSWQARGAHNNPPPRPLQCTLLGLGTIAAWSCSDNTHWFHFASKLASVGEGGSTWNAPVGFSWPSTGEGGSTWNAPVHFLMTGQRLFLPQRKWRPERNTRGGPNSKSPLDRVNGSIQPGVYHVPSIQAESIFAAQWAESGLIWHGVAIWWQVGSRGASTWEPFNTAKERNRHWEPTLVPQVWWHVTFSTWAKSMQDHRFHFGSTSMAWKILWLGKLWQWDSQAIDSRWEVHLAYKPLEPTCES